MEKLTLRPGFLVCTDTRRYASSAIQARSHRLLIGRNTQDSDPTPAIVTPIPSKSEPQVPLGVGVVWNLSRLESSGVARSRSESSGVLRSRWESSGVVRSRPKPSGVVWSRSKSSGVVRSRPSFLAFCPGLCVSKTDSGRLQLQTISDDSGRFRTISNDSG